MLYLLWYVIYALVLKSANKISQALAALSGIAFRSIPILQTYFYKILSKYYLILVATFIAITQRYLLLSFLMPLKLYLFLIAYIQALNQLLQYMYTAYQNINYSANLRSRASVEYIADAIMIKVKPAQPWECKARQFIYLYLPGLSYTAFIQAYPFFISWWDSKILVLLIELRRGFIESLRRYIVTELAKSGSYGRR